MKDNFDYTQFITFKYEGNEDISSILCSFFKESPFIVLGYSEIATVKKVYFNQHLEEYFFELKYDEFMGEFEDWKNKSEPTVQIQKFIDILDNLLKLNLKNLKIILTKFAEEGETSQKLVYIYNDKIKEGLFYMSSYNYDIWTDNLILYLQD